MTAAAAAPVHFDLDMKLCSGLSLSLSLRTSERQLRTHGLIMVRSFVPSSVSSAQDRVSWEDDCPTARLLSPADTLFRLKLFPLDQGIRTVLKSSESVLGS